MELAKSTEAFDSWWDSEVAPVDRWDRAAFGSRAVDEDLTRAWDVKAGLQWVRNDDSPLNRLRWSVWDRYGVGRPPSRVQERSIVQEAKVETGDVAPSSPLLRVVTHETHSSRGIGSSDEAAPLGVVSHS
jgi:hypothetical protein